MKNLLGSMATLAVLIRIWFGGVSSYRSRMLIIYAAGSLALLAGWTTGFVGPVVHQAGWVAWAVAVLVGLHAWTAFRTSDDPYAQLGWLEKIDTSILAVGFLGKLWGIAVVTGAVVTSGDPAAAQAGLGAIAHGVSAALISTIAGLAVSQWTHCVTLVYGHALSAAERTPFPAQVISR